MWWFKLVFPIVRGKNELAVALYIYRLRIIRRSRTVVISNTGLLTELAIDRYTKYRALRRLADAGIVQVRRHNKRGAQNYVFCQKRGWGSRVKWHVVRCTHMPHVHTRTSPMCMHATSIVARYAHQAHSSYSLSSYSLLTLS